MKRRIFKNARYSAIVIAGALLAATPMTALAEKSADATQVEAAEDTKTEGEGSADTTDTADSKDTTDAGKDTADKTTEDKTTDTTESTDKETESSETSADKTEESKDTEAETEKETAEAEETTADAAETETSAEETTATETTAAETTVAETTVAETTVAAQLKEKTLAQLLIGTWKADETTSLTFGESGKGKMSFAKDDYAFTYKLEDDELSLDFSSNKVIDCSYTISVTEDTLTLVGGAGTTGGTFDLTKNAD